ncbi:LOW QUALITY PROTEIN: uncharacterized protein [Panulirus ornatus]|uniref:LOW QUALITY PROTEIN: uncharacterized protein n=1 Tax=Panulirus ornatus TaxID=150431 RepID=UPI003A83E885
MALPLVGSRLLLQLILLLLAAATKAGASGPRVLHDPYYGIIAAYNLHEYPPTSPDSHYQTPDHQHSPVPPHYLQGQVYEEPKRPSAFQYRVKDQYHGTEFSRHESSDATGTKGQYQVQLPDGRLQTVIYHADEGGFHAEVIYDGEPQHPKPQDDPHYDPELTHHTAPNSVVYLSTPEPIYHSTPRPVYHSTPESIYHSTPKPVYHSTPKPIYDSRQDSIYHSTPRPVYHSTPEPVYHTTPEPVYHTTPEPVYHTTPEPVYHTTPEPVHHSTSRSTYDSASSSVHPSTSEPLHITEPKPVFSEPDPLYHSPPRPDIHHSTSDQFHPVHQSTPKSVYHSTPNSILYSTSETVLHHDPRSDPAHRAASNPAVHGPSDGEHGHRKVEYTVQEVVRSPDASAPRRAGVGPAYRTSTVYKPSRNVHGFTEISADLPPGLSQSPPQPDYKPLFTSPQPAYEVVHSSHPAYDYEIGPLPTQHNSPVLFVLADGRSAESLDLTHPRILVASKSHSAITERSTSTQPPPVSTQLSSSTLSSTKQSRGSHSVLVKPEDTSPKPIITSHAEAKPKDEHLSLKVNVNEPLFRSDTPALTPAPKITFEESLSHPKHQL